MPMSSIQLAALVDRARLKAPLVVSPPPAPPRKVADNPAKTPKPVARATARDVPNIELAAPPKPEPTEPPTHPTPTTPLPRSDDAAAAVPPDDFPIGWDLKRDSWNFHRRFHAIFKRPMRYGEYSHLLWQIRRRKAEHLWEDCWRVTMPGGRTLPVRATTWRLITILPKYWQPPQVTAAEASPDVVPVEA